jgi:ATP-dependent protease ClpP protease subunit
MKTNEILQEFRDRVQSRIGKEQASGRWYEIHNQDADVAEIRIYDEIHWFWGISADDFARDLDAITAPEILVMINSPGGDVFDGIAIYNALRAHPAKITTRVDGIAASIASVIAQAGDHRIMLTGAQMMIHEAWGLAIGSASEMRDYADLLDRQNDNIAAIYARRAAAKDKDAAYFRERMTKDTWLNDEETLAEGLADEVVDLPPNAATAKATNPETKTLQDEVREAMDVVASTVESAQRVAALRAEKGKDLSQVNRTSLDELAGHMARLQALLDSKEDVPASDVVDLSAEVAREFTKFVATNQ